MTFEQMEKEYKYFLNYQYKSPKNKEPAEVIKNYLSAEKWKKEVLAFAEEAFNCTGTEDPWIHELNVDEYEIESIVNYY